MRPLDVIRDALTRIVWIRDESDPLERERALEDLELDLVIYLADGDQRRAA